MIHALRGFLWSSLGLVAGCSPAGLSELVSTDPGPTTPQSTPTGENQIPVVLTTVGLISTVDGVEIVTVRKVTATPPGPRSDGTLACQTSLDCAGGMCVKKSIEREGVCVAGACDCGKATPPPAGPPPEPPLELREPFPQVAAPHPLRSVDTVCARYSSQRVVDFGVATPATPSVAPSEPTLAVGCVPADGKPFKYQTWIGGGRCDPGDPSRVAGEVRDGKWQLTTFWSGFERPRHNCGRPLLVEGRAIFAERGRGDDWTRSDAAAEPDLEWSDRLQAIAFEEHASVAAFSRTITQLVALGAPPGLLGETARALAEEITHAKAAFALAEALAPHGVERGGPAAFSEALAPLGALDTLHASLLVDVIEGGCIGEALSALEAHELREHAPTAARTFFSMVIEDEARHAALAWKTARWLVEQRPALAALAAQTVHERCNGLAPAARAMFLELAAATFLSSTA